MDGVDQNCFMTVGKGMMNGLVPYRDLFEQKGPLLYFLHGVAWLISNDTWIGVYILESLFLGVFLWYYWKIWNLYGERRWSMAWMPLLALLVTVTSSFASGGDVEEYCIALMAVSMYDYLKYLRDYPENEGHMDRRTLLVNGTLAGCVLWMKYTMLGFWFAWMATVFFCLILQKKWERSVSGLRAVFGRHAWNRHDSLGDLFRNPRRHRGLAVRLFLLQYFCLFLPTVHPSSPD